MTPARLVECLKILRWHTETLAEALGCDESLVNAWVLDLDEIPVKAGAWIDALTTAHAAAETLKPTGLRGKKANPL